MLKVLSAASRAPVMKNSGVKINADVCYAYPVQKDSTAMITIDSEYVYTVGDIHGKPQPVVRKMRDLGLHDAAFIVLGDCGLGMGLEKWLPDLQRELEQHNNVWYLLRGNHDNPFLYAAGQKTGYDRIRLLPDFAPVNIRGEVGLVLGGGTSLDRGKRRLGEDYWEEEVMNLNGAERAAEQLAAPLAFILAHTSPQPPSADTTALSRCAMMYADSTVFRRADEEQEQVSRALALFRPARWYAGHWHVHDDFMVGETRVLVHDIAELRPWG